MDKMQRFIDYIFLNVWCEAASGTAFSLDLFDEEPELSEVMTAFYFDDTKGAYFFCSHVERIYKIFASMEPERVALLKQWYKANNNVERACACEQDDYPVRYADLDGIDVGLIKEFKTFFMGLYDHQLLNLKVLRDKIGTIQEHFKAFREANAGAVCPFCGLNDLKGIFQEKIDAYDHYLPKSVYPFNSINLRNLAPTCHECNSTYKHVKDPLHCSGGRRKAFYPYSTKPYRIELSIALDHSDWEHIQPGDISLTFGPESIQDEITTWKEIYGIEERYKDKCCSEDHGKEWMVQILDEWREDERPPAEYMKTLDRHTRRKPFSDLRFLKKAFLDACQEAGLFETR
jgi:hypothetical protein